MTTITTNKQISLYSRLSLCPFIDEATGPVEEPSRPDPPGTVYTASIETIDNDFAGCLLGELAI